MVGPYNYGDISITTGPPEFVNEQVTIYKDGAVSTAQKVKEVVKQLQS